MKKAYQKPLLNRVNLAVEEAVLSACKTATGGTGPLLTAGTGLCSLGGSPDPLEPCKTFGS